LDEPRAMTYMSIAMAAKPHGLVLPRTSGGAEVQRLGARMAVQEARAGLPGRRAAHPRLRCRIARCNIQSFDLSQCVAAA